MAKQLRLVRSPRRSSEWSRRDFICSSVAAVAAGTSLLGCRADPGAPVADLILYGGEVHTVDPTNRVAEAIAIAGGLVLAVGSKQEIQRFETGTTRIIDATGRSVLPGINDSHLHALSWGMSQPPFTVDVSSVAVQSISEVTDVIRAAVAKRSPGEWISGRGWDQPYFSEGRAPTRHDLDAVSPENPVILTEFSGHAIWVNSKALELAGINRDTQPAADGVIVKDERGEPTGVLFEAATGLVFGVMPEMTDDVRRQGILAACDRMLAIGITSFTDPGIDQETLGVYEDLARTGELPVRANLLLRAGSSMEGLDELLDVELAPDIDRNILQLAGLKIFADGIPTGNKTAWLNEPYEGGGNGTLAIVGETDADRVDELREMIFAVHQAGKQIGTHATGDRTIDEVVDAYQMAMESSPRADPRHYLIHSDLVSPETLDRMGTLGIGGNFNASIKFLIADSQRLSLGEERAAYEWPYATALRSGVVVASSSDAPVTDGNWRQGIATAVLREGKQSGDVSGQDQKIGFAEALKTYTWGGAWQDHAEESKGSLEPGKLADLCVLDTTLSTLDLHDLPQAEVVLTVVNGQVLYERQ